MTDREKIIEIIKRNGTYNGRSLSFDYYVVQLDDLADALIAAGIGDTIYKVYDRCDGHNCLYNGYYGQWRCHYEGEQRCEPFIKIKQFDYSDIPLVNDTFFVSREAAEARLKEKQEEI